MRLEGIAKINQAVLDHKDDHGVITSFLDLVQEGCGQCFGPIMIGKKDDPYRKFWIKRITETVGVNTWNELEGKNVRVDGDKSRITGIGHISEDKWFYDEERPELMETRKPTEIEITLTDWLAEGERLFGPDKKQWKWKCVNCGHVQSIADFLELKKLRIIKAEVDVGSIVYFSCIGRFDTRIPEEDVGTIGDQKSPCDYTLGGLFNFANTYVKSESGKAVPVFDFAEELK